jgi:flavin reductase (DIM6/NTAB) family NADH-FMN oxidoreductase RutF
MVLITARKPDGSFNTMTASWGGMGVLWNKNVFFCFVRPQRYTHEFTEAADEITLSFLGEEYRNALKFCGSKTEGLRQGCRSETDAGQGRELCLLRAGFQHNLR